MFFGSSNKCLAEVDGPQEKAEYFLEGYKKERLKFFNQKIKENDSLYIFTKDEKEQLWEAFLSAYTSSPSNTLSTCWTKAWCEWATKNRVGLAVRYTLNKLVKKNDRIASLSSAEYELTQDLKKSLRVADKYLKFDKHKALNKQIKVLDASLLKYFKQHNTGPQAKAFIRALSKPLSYKDYDKRVEKWANPLYFPQLIARCRWSDYTRALVCEMENKSPALASPIHKQLLDTQTKGNRLNDKGDGIVDLKGKKILDFSLQDTACIGFETAKSILLSAIPLLSSVTAYYVITWLLREVHIQFLMGHKNPGRILLKGMAYERLGELSGAGTHPNTIAKIRKIIPALAGCLFKYRTKDRIGEGNFLSYRYEKAIGHNYSVLIIEMQPLACPGFITSLPKGGMKFQEQRKAIPVTRPFPFYGKQTNSFGLQLRFQYTLMQEMRDRAKELHQFGGIPLDDELVSNLASDSQLPKKTAEPMLDFWVKENCLSRSDEGLYNLGSRELAARKMMEEAGRYEIEGAIAAKKGLQKRRKKIQRSGRN